MIMKTVLCLVAVFLPAIALGNPNETKSTIGKKIDGFKLRDYRGAERSLADFADRKAVVVAFVGTECPLAKLYGPRLAELAKAYEPKGVTFIGINSNQQDSITAIAAYAKAAGTTFPILKDVGNVVADQFGALRTPEVFVLDGQRVIRYRGRIDDQYGIGYVRPKVEHRYLSNALDEILAGKQVSVASTETPGCFIGRLQRETAKGEITYTKHIAPILQNRCVECHRPGQIAPFVLTTYDEVIGWTDTIEEVLREGRMPPWHADPKYGTFANDARVPSAEKELIFQWIKNGAPKGDPRDMPKPVALADGWRIPKPDVVITIPKPFPVPAQGEVYYQFFAVDAGFTEDKWVKAVEVRPGCQSVVHHILVFVQAPDGGTDKYGGFAANWIGAIAPGGRPQVFPEGTAKLVPAGSRFLFQIHYTPNGAPQLDQSCMGMVFADPKTVKKQISTEMAANGRFAIPPHDPNYKIEATHTLKEDSLLLEMMPHTHLRGKAFRYEAFYPNGDHEILLDLPRYDFNWQNTYTLADHKLLPKGTKLHCTAYYDNSKDNPSNPDPEATVRWGDQTWDEMMIGYFNAMPAQQDLQKDTRPAPKTVAKATVPLDGDLRQKAARALDSDEAFAAFAAAVHKALPQLDRVCVTDISNGNLRVERANYPGEVAGRIAMAGFESHSRAYQLAYFALMGRFQYLSDISKARGIDLTLMSQTLGSSVHVPFALDGKPGTVNFWSKTKDGFTNEAQLLLRSVVASMVERGSSSSSAGQ
jgi:peroxiredoxin